MAWTVPRTWVVGEVVTAAQLNTHLRDDLNAVTRISFSSLSQVNVQNTTTDTEILQHTVPAGLLSTNGGVHVSLFGRFSNTTGSSQTVTFTINLSATTIYKSSALKGNDAVGGPFMLDFVIQNMNSASAQILNGWMGTFGSYQGATVGQESADLNNPQTRHFTNPIIAQNTAIGATIQIFVQLGIASNNLQFVKDIALVELMPAP
jgi:hypothetical protein